MRSQQALQIERLETVAAKLGEDLSRLVFVGGAVVALYDVSQHDDVRPTEDIDCIVDADRIQYAALQDRLRERGFTNDMTQGAPVCRFLIDTGLSVDVMPIDSGALGFSNPWYPDAIQHAASYALPSGCEIRAVSPLYFVATKLIAFKERGASDMLASHDLEDIFYVLTGTIPLRKQIVTAASEVCAFIRATLADAASHDEFFDAIEGYFRGDDAGARKLSAWVRSLSNTKPTRV